MSDSIKKSEITKNHKICVHRLTPQCLVLSLKANFKGGYCVYCYRAHYVEYYKDNVEIIKERYNKKKGGEVRKHKPIIIVDHMVDEVKTEKRGRPKAALKPVDILETKPI